MIEKYRKGQPHCAFVDLEKARVGYLRMNCGME